MQSFESIKEALTDSLRKPLPGTDAQVRMAPDIRIPREILLKKAPGHKQGGVLALLYPVKKEPFIVLTLRHEYDGAHSGQVSFPGGKFEQKDADISQTALRETNEEIGVNPGKVTLLGSLSELYIPASKFLVHPFVGTSEEQPVFKKDPAEVNEIMEVPLREFFRKDAVKHKPMTLLRGNKVQVPYFDIQGKVVWGATAMMLSELLTILGW